MKTAIIIAAVITLSGCAVTTPEDVAIEKARLDMESQREQREHVEKLEAVKSDRLWCDRVCDIYYSRKGMECRVDCENGLKAGSLQHRVHE